MKRKVPTVVIVMATFLWMGGSAAEADCSVDTRRTFGKSFRVIQCDESQFATDEAMLRAAESCETLDREFVDPCYDAIVGSFELRRESMLQRTLKEGASIKAAAELYGYTEVEVEQRIAENTPVDRGHSKPDEAPADVVQAEQDIAAELEKLGLQRRDRAQREAVIRERRLGGVSASGREKNARLSASP